MGWHASICPAVSHVLCPDGHQQQPRPLGTHCKPTPTSGGKAPTPLALLLPSHHIRGPRQPGLAPSTAALARNTGKLRQWKAALEVCPELSPTPAWGSRPCPATETSAQGASKDERGYSEVQG
ncbi:hypothetical protein KIL84_000275 [Mauremys mutica]|uniref:Uncharacterized protein n=1 Tax=Mauremys mutica TaxID=74926 RepID=A0A9D3XC65_9SAUR|nr:hypothetical protein KIL84_000275 [Mauremys mutica]